MDKGIFGSGAVQWVSTEWLQEHYVDQDLRILDCQPDIHDYKVHIPGAVYLSEKTLRVPLQGTPGHWIPTGAAALLFRRLGLRADTPVVVYTGKGLVKGWGDGLEQTMMAYSLVRFGHGQVYVLDGGLDKWLKEGRPTSQVFPKVQESDFQVVVRTDMFVDFEEFKRIKDDPGVILFDARPPNVYQGEGPWIRNGHIPGAVNLPWKGQMDADNPALLKPLAEIRTLVKAKGATSDKLIICSCGTGREATNEYLLFKHLLGYPRVRLYEGSFTEWSSHPENPVVTGPNPR
ncbi:MAG: sulfurtransferase [Chloroflexi bacterium]|nr:sulfurtransferase [Chloroflexota bacterium]